MHDDSTPSAEPTPGSAGSDSPDAASSGDPSTFSPWEEASDGDLILYTRAGDGSAYGELWRRHARAGRTVARSFTSSLDPDDLVQESFAKIYQALQKGGGPTGAFRPYLFTTIRNTASAWGRARREASIDTLESFEDPASRDEETMAALDRSLTATAFRSLPTRWQEVLWYCEVEQMSPQQVAPLLAMKPNAVAALAYRAREGLRQAWIQAHIAAVPEDSEHRWTIERIGSYTRGSLGKRDTTKIESHLDACARCTIVAAEAREVGSRIALVLLPLAAGTVGATGYLAWMQTGSHAALTTAAMPAAVLGGHGMSLGVPVDPTVLASLAGGTAGGGAAGSGAAASGAAGSSAGASSAGAASVATVSASTVSVGAVTTGIVSGAIALIAAGAVAAGLAFSPTAAGPAGPSSVAQESSNGSPAAPTPDGSSPTPQDSPTNTTPLEPGPSSASSAPQDSTPPQPSDTSPSEDPDSPSVPSGPQKPTPTGEPTPPVVVRPDAPVVSWVDSGAGNAQYPVVAGTAEPGALVSVRRGEELLTQVTSDANGDWMTGALRTVPVGDGELSIDQTADGETSSPAVARFTLRQPPALLGPTDGSIVFGPETPISLGTEFAYARVTGWVDGRWAFGCPFDGTGTPESGVETRVDWTSFGAGWHRLSVAFTDSDARTGPTREVRVFVVLPAPPPSSDAVIAPDAVTSSGADDPADSTTTPDAGGPTEASAPVDPTAPTDSTAPVDTAGPADATVVPAPDSDPAPSADATAPVTPAQPGGAPAATDATTVARPEETPAA